jgi:hypothetical protein
MIETLRRGAREKRPIQALQAVEVTCVLGEHIAGAIVAWLVFEGLAHTRRHHGQLYNRIRLEYLPSTELAPRN